MHDADIDLQVRCVCWLHFLKPSYRPTIKSFGFYTERFWAIMGKSVSSV